MLFNEKGGNNNNKKEQVVHDTVAHHQLTDAQPVSEQWNPTCSIAPILLLSMTLYGMDYPFGALGELSWLCSP